MIMIMIITIMTTDHNNYRNMLQLNARISLATNNLIKIAVILQRTSEQTIITSVII